MGPTNNMSETLQELKAIKLALDESSIIAITDSQGIIHDANNNFCEVSQYSHEELISNKYDLINTVNNPKSFFRELWKTSEAGSVWRGEIKNKAKDGSYYWIDTTVVPLLKADEPQPYKYIAISYNITTQKKYEQYIETMTYTDSLTNLPNRNQLSKWMKNFPKQGDEVLTVVYIDLDSLKIINENFGHDSGDVVLQIVAKRLKSCLHNSDFIFRQGGDEFIIILNKNESKEEISDLCTHILKQIAKPCMINGKQIFTTASLGISRGRIPLKNTTDLYLEKLIKNADTAMYYAKKQGGNQYCFNTDEQNRILKRNHQIELEIKDALERNEFTVVYQPIVNLKTNKIVGVEALLRWENRELGFVSPQEFIPILEGNGMIVNVGKWILSTVCNQMKSWQENGILMQRICVNVSPIQFKHKQFVQDLNEILNESLLDASYLELEITEGTILDIEHSTIIHKLKELGVKVSIDDFGTGYSSLSYLKQLPIDTLKIDKSFIDDLDRDGEIIANTIINMGKNLNFRVIAEGIESIDQLHYLQKERCHEGQGYYFSKPVNEEKITELFMVMG